MIILKMWGGLGNQMFIHAFYQSLLSRGIKAKIDLSWFDQYGFHNGYELKKVFGLEANIASKEEVKKYADVESGFKHHIGRKILKSNTQLSFGGHKAISFYPETYEMENVYLQGYWQSFNYFADIARTVISDYDFSLSKNIVDSIKIINYHEREYVSIHVRRGDYIPSGKISPKNIVKKVLLGDNPSLGDVCTQKYYIKAVDYIENQITNPYYCIFSDDIEWCKANLQLPVAKHCFVEKNTKENSYLDMYLMSQCNHNIIANSSFSWWGAWLNSHDDKIVIAPDRWFQDGYSGDIIPEDWIRISTI